MADVVTGDARDLFVAIASAAAALIGLLFVAITVTPRPAGGRPRSVIHQVRSAAALISFTNALAVSLFGLVPDNNAGWPAAAIGIVGVLFTLASVGCGVSQNAGELIIARLVQGLGAASTTRRSAPSSSGCSPARIAAARSATSAG